MSVTLKPYLMYKDTGVSWLGDVPEHWEVRRARNVVDMRVSNVDKHTKDGEIPIRLCNYVDVYKNQRITDRILFMRATATVEEANRFRLKSDDVLITKDSEAWNDIGVPALVEYTAEDLICGYHLALLRPRKVILSGGYLFRALQCPAVAYQFHVAANGVTRYGLSHDAIKSALVPIPPLPEQSAIIRFLDHYDRKIRRFIHAKQKLIKLLEEQKQAIINQTVTRGLDPNVRFKPSGVEWLGEVPEHWEIRPAKYFYLEVDERSITGDEELLSVSHITGVTPRKQKNVTMFMPESYAGSKLCQPNDLVINTMWAWMAALGISKYTGIVSPAYGVYRPIKENVYISDFVDLLLRIKPYIGEYISRSTGIRSSRLRLYPECFLRIKMIRPPLEEQLAILTYIREETENLDLTIQRTQREIDLIREYRTRLIADVVTGKLDVRNVPIEESEEIEELPELEGLDDEFSLSEEVGELEDADN